MTQRPKLSKRICFVVCCLFPANVVADAAETVMPSDSAATAQEAHFGNQVPAEWIDPKTGHRIVRLSKEAGSASLYFHQSVASRPAAVT